MSEKWGFNGHSVSKPLVVYISQVVLVYIVVITGIVNLSTGAENQNLWIILLSSSIGYLLPSPSVKNERILPEFAEQHSKSPRGIP
jgi:hypothetical protein